MSGIRTPNEEDSTAGIYEIRVKGHLANRWTGWFGQMTITLESRGETILKGPVVDQAALHGLLRKVRDLGLPLLSVNRVSQRQAKGTDQCAAMKKRLNENRFGEDI